MASITHTIRLVASAAAAIVEVRKYEDAIAGAAQTVERYSNTLSGDKLLKSANEWTAAVAKLGGASNDLATSEQIVAGAAKLTEAEQAKLNVTLTQAVAKYQALGEAAPPAMIELEQATRRAAPATEQLSTEVDKVNKSLTTTDSIVAKIGPKLIAAFTVTAVAAAIKSVGDYAGAIADLSAKTGIGTDALQRFKFAAEQNGATLDQVASAVNVLERNIASGDKSAVAAVNQLGFSLKEFTSLSPEQKFEAVSVAISGLSTQGEKANTAFQLMGRTGVELLPVLTANVKELGDQAQAMGLVLEESAIKNANAMGDSFDALLNVGKSLIASVIGPFVPALKDIATAAAQLSPYLQSVVGWFTELWKIGPSLGQGWMKNVVDFFDVLRGKLDVPELKAPPRLLMELPQAAMDAEQALALVDAAFGKNNERVRTSTTVYQNFKTRGLDPVIATAPFASTAIVNLRTSVIDADGAVQQANIPFAIFGTQTLPTVESAARDVADALSYIPPLASTAIASFAGLPTVTGNLQGLNDEVNKTPSLLTAMKDAMGTVLGSIPALITGILSGDVLQSFVNFGNQIAQVVVGPLIRNLPQVRQAAIAMGSGFAQVIGNEAGGGMAGQIAGLASGIGGLALSTGAAGAYFTAMGMAGTVALGAATLGIGAAAVGVYLLVRAWSGVSQEEKEARELVRQYEAAILGTLNAQQLAEAGGESWAQTTIGVRDAYLAVGRSAAEAERDVKALWDSSRNGAEASQAAIDRITTAFAEQQRRMDLVAQGQELLTAAAQRYGFTIEELGPAMQRQRLSEMAEQLYADYQILIGSGIEVETVTNRMSEAINEYVGLALRTGSEVPIAMRPMIERMAEMGVLTDENGEALNDLSRIPWAETMTEGFNRVIAKLDELVRAMNGDFTPAVTNAATTAETALDKVGGATGRVRDEFEYTISPIEDMGKTIEEISDRSEQALNRVTTAVRGVGNEHKFTAARAKEAGGVADEAADKMAQSAYRFIAVLKIQATEGKTTGETIEDGMDLVTAATERVEQGLNSINWEGVARRATTAFGPVLSLINEIAGKSPTGFELVAFRINEASLAMDRFYHHAIPQLEDLSDHTHAIAFNAHSTPYDTGGSFIDLDARHSIGSGGSTGIPPTMSRTTETPASSGASSGGTANTFNINIYAIDNTGMLKAMEEKGVPAIRQILRENFSGEGTNFVRDYEVAERRVHG